MNKKMIVTHGLCVAVLLVVGPTGSAYAAEGASLLQPGATTGNAAGALPPPGLYINTEPGWETGSLVGGNGKKVTISGQHVRENTVFWVNSLVWIPGWHILGADYGASITQIVKWPSVHYSGGLNYKSAGLFNTMVTPEILSWDLGGGFHVSEGMTFGLDDGYTTAAYNVGSGRVATTSKNIGDAFYTFEPNFAISYLKNGWNLTANNALDFNTKNTTTGYQSGDVYYLDLTATKRFGNWTLGLIGNYTQQFTDDTVNGQVVAASNGFSRGSRIMHVKAGPLVSYDFGRFQVTARYLQAITTRNDYDVSIFHIGLSMKLF